MPTSLSDAAKAMVAQFFWRTGTPTKPTVLAIALCTAAPAADGSNLHEVANLYGYARIALNPDDANWDYSAGLVTNLVDVLLGPASGGSWGTVTHLALVTSTTYGSGTYLVKADALINKTVGDGDTASLAAGNIVFNLNGS